MKAYLLIVLITFTACVKQLLIDKSELVVEKSSSTYSEEDAYFTICLEFMHNPEYLDILKEYLEEVPDNKNEMDVCYEVMAKLSEQENFDDIISQITNGKNDVVVYSVTKSSQVNNDFIPFNKRLAIDERTLIEPEDRLDMEYDIVLKWPWKINWKKLFNALIDVVTAFIPPLDPVLDKYKFQDV